MYLFSRRARLAPGNTRDALTWATNVTEKASEVSGLTISLFTPMFSPEVGMLSWSAFSPDLATLEAATDKLAVDDAYISLVDAGAKFAQGGADDRLLQIVSGNPDPNRRAEYVSAVASVCANGALTRGIELGVEIAQRAEKTTSIPGMFTTSATGNYGAVGWITGFTDVKEMEAAQAALAADTSFGAFIDKNVKGVYTDDPSATQATILRRII